MDLLPPVQVVIIDKEMKNGGASGAQVYHSVSAAKDRRLVGGGVDLKAMLVDVLRRQRNGQVVADNAKLRIIDIDQDQSFVILNKLSDPATWNGSVFAGQLIHLQEGSEVQAVMQSLEEDTAEFVLRNLKVGAQARVLKGALYFAIVGNHVGLIEGQQV